MYEFFSSTNVFSLVESCQLYIITNTKPATKIEEGIQRCSVKKVFLKTLQKSREIPCARSPISFLIKLQLKKRLWHRRFPVNIAKFSRLPFFNRTLPVAASGKINTKSLKSAKFQFQLLLTDVLGKNPPGKNSNFNYLNKNKNSL